MTCSTHPKGECPASDDMLTNVARVLVMACWEEKDLLDVIGPEATEIRGAYYAASSMPMEAIPFLGDKAAFVRGWLVRLIESETDR